MKIKITENIETETEKVFCDICFEEIPSRSFYICSICNRDICYKCFGKPKEINGISVMPCSICRKITKYTDRIRYRFEVSDSHRETAFRLQEQWGKESRRKNATK